MSEPKTKPSDRSVADFLAAIEDEQKRQDSEELCRLMEEVTGEKPVLWGDSIVGFGSYHYTYASGHSGDWPVIGFSPRKQNLTIYIMDRFEKYQSDLQELGPHSTGKSCLYIKRLADIKLEVLRRILTGVVASYQ